MSSSARALVPGGRPRRAPSGVWSIRVIARPVPPEVLFPSPGDVNVSPIRHPVPNIRDTELRSHEERLMAESPTHRSTSSRSDRRPDEPVVEDVLVEEVSIDGMCGVY